MTGLALGATSDADGLGYVALNDLALEDAAADYRVIGGGSFDGAQPPGEFAS